MTEKKNPLFVVRENTKIVAYNHNVCEGGNNSSQSSCSTRTPQVSDAWMELGGERFQNRVEFFESTDPVHSFSVIEYLLCTRTESDVGDTMLKDSVLPSKALCSFTQHPSGTSPPAVEVP